MKIEKCRGKTCEAQIVWHKTVHGKWMPFDVKPIRAFILQNQDEGQIAVSVPALIPHHATCPDAEDFRKR